MAVIHNGKEIPNDYDFLLEKWKIKEVEESDGIEKPSFCVFNNTAYALDLLHKHIDANSIMALHTDVDVDGIGTTYIFKRVLENLGSNKHILIINKNKDHGIMQKHVDYFKTRKIDLMIITDSSCNEIDTIKQFNCDILVIDHHKLLHEDLVGYCNDNIHRYVIVNNTIANKNQEQDNLWLRSKNISAFNKLEDYKETKDMSCGLVVYELLRLYCECFANPKLMENLMLYQWVGITLFTDVINTLNLRNQYYLNKTVFNNSTERTLKTIMSYVNKYKATLDKSYIEYSFAPLINKAIRADAGAEALDKVINNPNSILDLLIYDAMQKEVIDKVVNITDSTGKKYARVFNTPNIMLNISREDIKPTYSGVIASKLSGDNNKNAAVYRILDNGLCKGSFRGKYKETDYRQFFDEYSDDIYAQGHDGAFGFKLTQQQLDYLMNNLYTIEPQGEQKPWITLGNMTPEEYGEYHINNLEEFKKLGYLWRISIGNSKVSSKDEITITVKASDVVLKQAKGRTFIYDVLGLECKAFKPLSGEYFEIYMEYTNELSMFIK